MRTGSLYPDWLLERRKRAERALTSVVATCYLLGVSTRRMDKLVQTLGITGLSKSQVSVMAKELDEHVEQFRTRRLEESGPFTFVAADALVLKVREGGRVVPVHVLVATGVNADGHRQILGVQVTTSEDGAGWLAFFRDLSARGLTGSSSSPQMPTLGWWPRSAPPSRTRAGEAGGFLDVTMRQIADNFEAEVKLRSKIKAAMTYPIVVFVLAILMCIGMLIFIVPVFEGMFSDLGGELPLPTQVLVLMSKSLRVALPVLVVLAIAGLWVWRKVGRTERVRNVVDPLKLRLPVFGDRFAKLALARFARNLGTLLSSGVPILQSLEIVSETTGSVVISRALKEVQESVRRGESVAGPLAQHAVFPPMVVQMIASGEETGAIDQMLGKIAEFYDDEVEATTEALTALIEPLMIAFLGAIVGSMIIALYMPIFKVFELIG